VAVAALLLNRRGAVRLDGLPIIAALINAHGAAHGQRIGISIAFFIASIFRFIWIGSSLHGTNTTAGHHHLEHEMPGGPLAFPAIQGRPEVCSVTERSARSPRKGSRTTSPWEVLKSI
jgi:hypothetical protein